jgi:hypothetical protein
MHILTISQIEIPTLALVLFYYLPAFVLSQPAGIRLTIYPDAFRFEFY